VIFPTWTPIAFQNLINGYNEFLSDSRSSEHADLEAIKRDAEIWTRLTTRPEMESVWKFILARDEFSFFADPENLARANGGLVAKLGRYLRAYHSAPILSEREYKNEMLEISKLAERLSGKLKKFCDAGFSQNPFSNSSMFTFEEIERFGRFIDPKLFENKKHSTRSITAYLLDLRLPLVNHQLHALALRAKNELNDPRHKLQRLPRKVGDANVFRTYFISVVRNIFLGDFADGSHARLATFCSVALDDPEITADLVRQIAPIDDETKEFLKSVKSIENQ